MKKIYLGIIVTSIATMSLYAGVLTGESTSGMYKTCYYSDGQAMSIPYTGYCPYSN